MRTTKRIIRAIKRAWTAIHKGRALDKAFRLYLQDADHADGQAGTGFPRQVWVLTLWCFVALC